MYNNVGQKIIRLFKQPILWLAVILLLGFLVRLYKIDNPLADWHSWRQADTASVTRIYLNEGIDILRPRYYDISSIQSGIFNPKGLRLVEFPVFNIIHLLFVNTFKFLTLEEAGRLVSIVFSMISAYLVYLLGKRFISVWGGVLAAFFFAFIPYNIFFSRVILPEPMSVTFSLLAIWFFVIFTDKKALWAFYISALFFALSLLIKPYNILFLIPPIMYLYFKKFGIRNTFIDGKSLIRVLTYLLIVIAPFFLWRIWINKKPQGIPFYEWAFNGDHIRFRPAFWRWIFAERLGRLILGIWGIALFCLGLLKEKKDYFIHFFLLGMFFYVSVVATANVRHDYYQIVTIPAISLALAQGSVILLDSKIFRKVLSYPLFIFLVFMFFMVGWYQVKDFYQINHPEIIEAGTKVDEIAPKDSWVIAPYDGDTAFLYQTKRFGWPAVDDSIEKLVEKGADYYVSVNLEDPDTEYVQKHYKVLMKTDKYLIANLHEK
jgi:hypothetical protein